MRANKNGGKKPDDYKASSGTKRAAKYKKEEHAAAKSILVDPSKLDPDERLTMGWEIFISRLIMNRFDQKTMEQMLQDQMGIPREQTPKVPRDCLERATMRNENGEICILPAAFKKSILSGATGLKKTSGLNLRSKMFVTGHSIPIEYESKIDRVDMVRVGPWNNRVADIRFRPQFNNVTAILVMRFPSKISQPMMDELINRGGEQGVGEWRPEKGGDFGTYEVKRTITDLDELSAVMKQQSSWIPPLTIPAWALDSEISATLAAKIMSGDRTDLDAPGRPMTEEELEEARIEGKVA